MDIGRNEGEQASGAASGKRPQASGRLAGCQPAIQPIANRRYAELESKTGRAFGGSLRKWLIIND